MNGIFFFSSTWLIYILLIYWYTIYSHTCVYLLVFIKNKFLDIFLNFTASVLLIYLFWPSFFIKALLLLWDLFSFFPPKFLNNYVTPLFFFSKIILSMNRNNFISCFPVWCLLFLFLAYSSWLRPPVHCWIDSSWTNIGFWKNTFNLSSLGRMLAMDIL